MSHYLGIKKIVQESLVFRTERIPKCVCIGTFTSGYCWAPCLAARRGQRSIPESSIHRQHSRSESLIPSADIVKPGSAIRFSDGPFSNHSRAAKSTSRVRTGGNFRRPRRTGKVDFGSVRCIYRTLGENNVIVEIQDHPGIIRLREFTDISPAAKEPVMNDDGPVESCLTHC
jgi:hypothetical protein